MICVVIASLETGRGRVERVQGVVSVGRDPRCNVVLEGRGVSGSHCRLSPMPELPGAYLLEDLASTYGTFVNSARVGRPVVVSTRDVISVGSHSLMLAEPGQEQAAIAHLSSASAPAAPNEPPPPVPTPTVPQLAAFDARAPWMQQFEYFDALARAWQDAGRSKTKLLRGPAVAVAEQWLAAGAQQSPTPSALHRDFIELSRNRRSSRVQLIVVGVIFAALAVAAAIAAFIFREQLDDVFDTPQIVAIAQGPQSPDVEAPGAPSIDLDAMVAAVEKEEDASERLLLESAVAEVARAQGKPLLSDAAWGLQTSTHAGLAERRETVLRDHGAAITDVEFAPDGVVFASASEDGSARLWDFSTPAPTRGVALRGHVGAVFSVAFSPRGDLLATGGDDGKVFLWRVGAKDPVSSSTSLTKHDSAVRKMIWHPSGRWLITGSDNGALAVWNVETRELASFAGAAHDGPVTAFAFEAGESPTLWSGGTTVSRGTGRWETMESLRYSERSMITSAA